MSRSPQLLSWMMVPTAAGLLVLLGLTLLGWPRTATPLGSGGRPGGESSWAPLAAQQTRQYSAWSVDGLRRPLTNTGNPFFTLAIQPAPPPKPPPPPPATRKVEVTYRGFFETSARVRRAVIQVADKERIAGQGDTFLADYAVVAIEFGKLSATNKAGVAVELNFGKTLPIEVPAK